jgi:hypothetical protein
MYADTQAHLQRHHGCFEDDAEGAQVRETPPFRRKSRKVTFSAWIDVDCHARHWIVHV